MTYITPEERTSNDQKVCRQAVLDYASLQATPAEFICQCSSNRRKVLSYCLMVFYLGLLRAAWACRKVSTIHIRLA